MNDSGVPQDAKSENQLEELTSGSNVDYKFGLDESISGSSEIGLTSLEIQAAQKVELLETKSVSLPSVAPAQPASSQSSGSSAASTPSFNTYPSPAGQSSHGITPQGIRSRWQNEVQPNSVSVSKESARPNDRNSSKRRWQTIFVMCALAVILSFFAAVKSVGEVGVIIPALIGGAVLDFGMPPLAMYIFNNTCKSSPQGGSILLGWANKLSDKNPQFAESMYDEITVISPTFASGYMNRGLNLLELHRFPEAIASFDRAIALNPHYALAYNNRAHAFFEHKSYDRALNDYGKAIELNGKFDNSSRSFFWFNRGYCYLEMEQWQKAIDDFNTAIENGYKDDTWVFNNRGYCLQSLGRLKEAIADYTIAINLDKTNKNALQGRGYCYQQLGDNRWIEDRRNARDLPDN